MRNIKNLEYDINQYNVEGEIIDNLTRVFEVRKMYKCTPKHMKFKVMNGKKVELKTTLPMDYIYGGFIMYEILTYYAAFALSGGIACTWALHRPSIVYR